MKKFPKKLKKTESSNHDSNKTFEHLIIKNRKIHSLSKFKLEKIENSNNLTKFSKTFGQTNYILPIRCKSRQNSLNLRKIIITPPLKTEETSVFITKPQKIAKTKIKLNPIKKKLITKNFQIINTEDIKEISKINNEIKQMNSNNQGTIININHNINHNIQINVTETKQDISNLNINNDDDIISFSISDDSSSTRKKKINEDQFKKFCQEIEQKLKLKK